MRVLIVSDTHGRHGNFDRALEEAGELTCLSISVMLKAARTIWMQ